MFIYRNVRCIVLGSSLLLTFFLCGCNSSLLSDKEKINTENVMTPGDRIVAVNDFGMLTITAGKDNRRYLTVSGQGTHAIWLGDTVSVKLTERKKGIRVLWGFTAI
jgi:hypothetical protein